MGGSRGRGTPSCVHICVDIDYEPWSSGTYDNRDAIPAFLDEHLFFGVRVKVDEIVQNVFLRERAIRVVPLIVHKY